MIHGLFRCELGNRRHDSIRIAGQHDHIIRVTSHSIEYGIFNMGDGVTGSCIFREATIIEVEAACIRIQNHVFKQGTKPPGALMDFGLRFLGQANHFGVTPAFKVKDAPIAPSVFVIPYQLACRVGGQGGFPGSGKTKKYC